MTHPLSTLAPTPIWDYFYALTQIPRPSHHEAAVQQYVLDEAARLGLWAERDAVGNVLVRKPATKGMEDAPGVILQNHLDIVAQKNADSDHNFPTDPLDVYIDGDWVTAKGTTLGADNGIGAACALAVLASDDVVHGPLEALFTATEETGMDGAEGLQGGWLQGTLLLNLDTEDLGDICIGCAGGIDATFSLPINWQAADTTNKAQAYTLNISGLKGGHSGVDIHKQRGNAALITARLVDTVLEDIHIADMTSGDLRNAIPREASATFVSSVPQAQLQEKIEATAAIIRRGLPVEDRNMVVTLNTADMPSQYWDMDSQAKIITALRLCPNGVDRMSMDTAGVVETSSNLAKISVMDDTLEAQCLLRSLDDDARDDLADRMKRLFDTFGAAAVLDNAYPGWKPNPGAPVTDVVIAQGEKILGRTPAVTVMHAGLECGLLGQHYPNWQMVSFGPTIEMPHSPDERVNIESVAVFWEWLVSVLGALRSA